LGERILDDKGNSSPTLTPEKKRKTNMKENPVNFTSKRWKGGGIPRMGQEKFNQTWGDSTPVKGERNDLKEKTSKKTRGKKERS